MILKNLWKLTNVKELLVKGQLSLIKEVMKASLINFPFQNISSYGSFIPNDRRAPNFGQILASHTRGEGGLCNHLNNHIKLQLESFGIHADLVAGCFRRTGVPMSHFVVKIKIPGHAIKDSGSKPMDPKPKDREFIVDVGCGIPLHEPIPLDNLPLYGRAAGLRYRYERVDDKVIQRVNECGDAIMGKKDASFESPQDYEINTTPRQFDEFMPTISHIYSTPTSSFFHYLIYCTRYRDITEDDFEMICVRGTDLIFITKETRHVQSFGTLEKIKPVLYEHFPMINPLDVDLTIKHFSMPLEEAMKIPATKRP